jgi:hypothetical protein
MRSTFKVSTYIVPVSRHSERNENPYMVCLDTTRRYWAGRRSVWVLLILACGLLLADIVTLRRPTNLDRSEVVFQQPQFSLQNLRPLQGRNFTSSRSVQFLTLDCSTLRPRRRKFSSSNWIFFQRLLCVTFKYEFLQHTVCTNYIEETPTSLLLFGISRLFSLRIHPLL